MDVFVRDIRAKFSFHQFISHQVMNLLPGAEYITEAFNSPHTAWPLECVRLAAEARKGTVCTFSNSIMGTAECLAI